MRERRGLGRHERRMVCDADSGGRGRQSEPELAVLRFSIGLPELEENLRLPRAIGAAAAVLILANLATPSLQALVAGKSLSVLNSRISASSVPSSVIGLMLALACMAMPQLDDVLTAGQQTSGGARGNAASGSKPLPLAVNDSLLDVSETENDAERNARRAELAWASYTLLRNTPACAILLCADNAICLYRGEMGDGRHADDRQEFLRGATRVLFDKNTDGVQTHARIRVQDVRTRDRDEGFFPADLGDVIPLVCTETSTTTTSSEGDIRVLLFLPEGASLSARDLSWSEAVAEKMADTIRDRGIS